MNRNPRYLAQLPTVHPTFVLSSQAWITYFLTATGKLRKTDKPLVNKQITPSPIGLATRFGLNQSIIRPTNKTNMKYNVMKFQQVVLSVRSFIGSHITTIITINMCK